MGVHDLWSRYRDSFRQFEQAAVQVPVRFDAADAEAALVSVEQARLVYNDARDRLAASLMSADVRQAFWLIPVEESERVVQYAGGEMCCR